MSWKRGDIVLCNLSGDYGKPRPAVVIQSDFFNETHSSTTLCPLTTHLVESPLFRLPISPSKKNGLSQNSQLMIDKITSVKREKIKTRLGSLDSSQIQQVNEALQLWIGLL